MNTTRRAAAAVLALALVAAACGDDDDDTDTTVGATSDVTAEEADATTTTATDATAATTQPTAAASEPKEGTADTSETTDAAATTTPVDGFVFTDPNGAYSIVMPEEPQEFTQEAPMPDGSTLPVTMHMHQTPESAFGVSSSTYPEGTDTSLEGARDGALANINAELVSSEPITLQRREGLEFEATLDQAGTPGVYRAQIFLDGLDLYQVIFVGAEGAVPEADVDAFFDSFQFAEG